MSERLAAWAGPKKTLSRIVKTQNHKAESTARAAPPKTPMAATAIMTVGLAPIRSSIQAKAAAPSPAATFKAIPKTMISEKPMPKAVPA